MTLRFIPLPTSAARPLLAAARLRVIKAERLHDGQGEARRSYIRLTARHLAFEVAQERRAARRARAEVGEGARQKVEALRAERAALTPDLFGAQT